MSGMASGYSGAFQSYAEGILANRIAERQAEATGYETAYAEEMSRKSTKKLMGRQRVLYAKSGVDISEGSPLEIMASTASEGEREALTIRRAGMEKAKMERWYGKVAKKAGRMAFYSGMTSGTISGIQSAASIYSGMRGGGASPSYGSGAMWSNSYVGSRGY